MENDRYKIIIVDDNMANLTMGMNMLKTFYDVTPVQSAPKFLEILEKLSPDLVLLDIEMPEMNGYEAIKKMKEDPCFADIPVIFLTAKNDELSELEGFNLGASDYIAKPFSAPILLKRIAKELLIVQQKKDILASRAALKDYADNLEEKVDGKTREVLNLQDAVISTMADLVEFRDDLTGGHILRTQRYLQILLDEMIRQGIYVEDVAKWNLEIFLSSAPLHDVGKIAISDLILNKPGKLDPDEFEIMKSHVTAGINIIEKIMKKNKENVFLRHALYTAGTHHERWDGLGYPMGLRGYNIPLEGRLMAIADVYDALIAVRPYKKAMEHEEAYSIIENGSGAHFDPALIEVFKTISSEFNKIAREITA